MLQVGIFTGYFPYGLEETASRIRALGFNTVQLDMHFKDVDVSAGSITRDKCVRIRDTFRDRPVLQKPFAQNDLKQKLLMARSTVA